MLQLNKIFTQANPSAINKYAEPLMRLMPEYGINTPLRQAHFMAQIAQESGEFRFTEENLNYSATRLLKVFPKYYRTTAQAKGAAYQPEVIANTVYANRMGNGDAASGDGYLFRGRGLIQLTGRNNYQSFLDHLLSLPKGSVSQLPPDVVSPDRLAPLLSNPELAVRSACYFWQSNGLNTIADLGSTDAVVEKVSRRVNGGKNGLSQRLVYFYRAIVMLKNM